MKSLKKIIIPIAFVILVALVGYKLDTENTKTFTEFLVTKIETTNPSPKNVFHRAWRIVNNNFVDENYNNQNWQKWLSRYDNQIKTYEDAYVAIESMLASLDDPYSRFLDPEELEEQDRSIEAKLFGIGVHISSINGNVQIVGILGGTPAERAGLREHDRIIKVNGHSTKGLLLSEVAELVRGEVGSSVELTILRDKERIISNIVREEIHIKAVESEMLSDGVGYIKLSSFISNDTADEFRAALESLSDAKGYIIDIRGNYGGLLPNAVYISNMFIESGNIVSIVTRDGSKKDFVASPFSCVTFKPVVLLIDQASASASEILSGALKDHNRAVLIGKKTFGKGRVQRIIRLPNGSGLNITIAKYLTPNGTDIDKKGIEPDFEVAMTKEEFIAGKDPQLDKAKEILKAELLGENIDQLVKQK